MAIKLYSGLPGSGKTAQLVADIMRMLEKEPGRKMYAIGINGLVDGLVEVITPEQLYRWWELPTGSAVFIDEAQESHLMPLTRNDPPEWIRKLSKIRHYGIDFYLTTQRPNYLSTYVRGLIDNHTHYVRKFNTHVVQSFTWGSCVDNPRSRVEQKISIQSVAALPRQVFALYKSANVHNMKRRIPRQVYMLGAAILLAAVSLALIPKALHHATDVAQHLPGAPAASSSAQSVASLNADESLRVTDYAKWMRPRVAGLPWTAPAFDHETVVAEPKLYCIAADDGRCSCYTEQGTRSQVELAVCRSIVQNGVYNPFQRPLQSDREDARRQRRDDDAEPRTARADRSSSASADDQFAGTGYRERSTAKLYQPPELVPHEAPSTWTPHGGK